MDRYRDCVNTLVVSCTVGEVKTATSKADLLNVHEFV